jgi:hypothetical protein
MVLSSSLEAIMPEPTSNHPQVAAWLAHIRHLAVDIGPRGPTRPEERQGALYAQAQFKRIGLQLALETFKSARSIFHPHLLGSALMLLAFGLFPLGGKVTAAIAAFVSIFALVNELLELSFINNFFRVVMPKGESQNVYAVIPPAGEHRRDLVLVGHLDSQRTPLIFKTHRWVKAYGLFTTITFVTFILQAILFSLAVFIAIPWAWYASLPAAICAVLLAAMCLQAEATPFTAGANDNASAVGLVLALAELLAAQPLQHTRVYAVCTGCEEVQHYGMIDFYKRHQAELKNPTALVFEMLGCASPAWLIKEGIIVPFKANPHLVQMAEQLSAEHPEWESHPAVISGGNTEMADALRCKIPAITLTGMTREGVSPYWHQKADTFDKMDPRAMQQAWEMSRAMIECLDRDEA